MSSRSYQRMSSQDSSFIMFEGPGTHMHVSMVGLFEAAPLNRPGGGLDVDRLRSYVESRLHLLPRYRQRLDFTPLQRHPIWVDDTRFNLHYHVRHTALPHPGSEAQLKQLAGRILSQQLDRDKPLWEMWLVEGLSGGRVAVLAKIHHCMVDGVAGVSLLQTLLSPSPDETIDSPPSWKPRQAPSRAVLLRDELVRGATTPLAVLGSVRAAFEHPDEASANLADGADAVWQALNAGVRRATNTPLNRPIGTHRRIDWCTLDLGGIKEVRKHLDGTVNDVVLTVVTGAVRRFLRRRRARLRGLDFRVVIPVNLRSEGEILESRANRVSAWFLSLPVAERDPHRQFAAISAQTERLKQSKTAEGFELFGRVSDWAGADLLTSWGIRIVTALRPYNMIVTNVPGPQFPLYLLGARLLCLHPQLPLFPHQGLGVAAVSYLGQVSFGVVADWDTVPDLASFTGGIDESFQDLRQAAAR